MAEGIAYKNLTIITPEPADGEAAKELFNDNVRAIADTLESQATTLGTLTTVVDGKQDQVVGSIGNLAAFDSLNALSDSGVPANAVVTFDAFDIGNLSGVELTTPAGGEVLTYDATTELWVNAAPVDLSGYATNDDLTLKADKILPSVVGNVATLDAFGNLTDGGVTLASKANATTVSSHTGASTGVHGVTGSVVGTTDTQTLTNKTITGTFTGDLTGELNAANLDTNATGVGFYGITPVARQSATTDLKDALTNYGLLQGTSATPLNLDGGAFTAGTISGTTGTFSSSISATSATFNGNITLTGSGGENRTINFGANLGASALTLYDSGSNGTRWGWGINAGEMQFYCPASGSNHFSWNAGGDLQGVGTNEKMRLVIATGALLINTTSDDGVNKLQVNGGITATSISNNISTQKIVTSYGKTAAGTALTTGQSSTAQSELNFIAGTNVTLTVNNNTSNSRVDVTIAASGGSGSPGGSNTQVQFNDSSAFGGDAGLTYDKTTDFLTVTGGVITPAIRTLDQPTVASGSATNAQDLTIRSGNGGDVTSGGGTAGHAGDIYILGGEGGESGGVNGPELLRGDGGDVVLRGGLGGGANSVSNGTYGTTEGSVIVQYPQPGYVAMEVSQNIGILKSSGGTVSIDFNQRVLADATGVASVDWFSRTLVDAAAGTSLTWSASGVHVAKALTSGIVTLTDAATVSVNPASGNHFRLLTTSGIGATRAIGAPGTSYDGHKITFEFIQDATGSRTVTLTTGSSGAFIYGTDITSITLTTTGNKRDIMGAIYSTSLLRWMVVSFIKGF